MTKISESTTFSWGVVAAIVAVTLWLASLQYANSEAIKTAKVADEKSDESLKYVRRIDRRLARIEGKLGLQPLSKHDDAE